MLRRWLFAPETAADAVVGSAIAGAIVLLLFRFAFGDSWAFAAGGGAVAFAASLLVRWLMIRRRKAGGAG